MHALVAAGDPTAAREHARVHAAYVRAELGGPVAEAVVALANQLRSDAVPHESTLPRPRLAFPPRPLIPRGPERRSGSVAAPAPAAIKSSGATPTRGVPREAWWATMVLWLIALLSHAT
jgi:hypothetical protein